MPNLFFFNWKTQIIFSKGWCGWKKLAREEWKSWSKNAIYLIDLEKSVYTCIYCMTFKSTWDQTLLYGNFWLLFFSRAKISLSTCIAWAVSKTNTRFINKVNRGMYTTIFFPPVTSWYTQLQFEAVKLQAWAYQVCRNLNCLNVTIVFPCYICSKGIICFLSYIDILMTNVEATSFSAHWLPH